ncbi:MAG: proteasome subunit beta [Promethearchaeota archaeon]
MIIAEITNKKMINNNLDHRNIDEKELAKAIQTGTTTVGIIVKDGVAIGTESQASAGFLVASKQAQKLFKVNDFTAATIAGGVADCQYVVSQVRALSRIKEVEEGIVPEPKYIASIVRNILFSGRSFFMSMMIVGGYSVKEKGGMLTGIDMLGTLYEEDSFISFGSGSPFSLGVLEADWKPNMSKADGVNLIKTAITSSRERDAGSGYNLQLCTIDKAGYKQVQ